MSGPASGGEGRRHARPGAELDVALNHLQARVEAEEAPSRYDARWLLLELGGVLMDEGEEASRPRVARARKVVQRLGQAWEQAVAEELQLAAAEHVHAVDPRWLTHPRYDLAYTLSARERLEARIVAAEALGSPLDEGLLAAVQRADGVLQEHRGGAPPAADTKPQS